MAGSGSISAVVLNYHTIDCSYSVNVTGSGRQALLECIDMPHTISPIWIWLGSGFHQGIYSFASLVASTNYRFCLYDYKSQSDYTTLATTYASTPGEPPPPPPPPPPPEEPPPEEPPPPPPPPPPTTSGTLSANATSPTTVSLNYSYQNGSSVSLFRDSTLVITFGSGSSSGVYADTVSPDTVYLYTLRNGATIGSTLLASATIGTPPLPAEGTLSGQIIDSATIDLTYSFSYGINVSLFRDSVKVTTFGSGSGSGTYRNGELTADTSYIYTLRNGSLITDTLLATATKKTLKEARKVIIERGKILPLSSQITIFNSTLTRLGILEKYEYTYWNFKYRSVGEFKLKINRYLPNTEYLVKGNLLAIYVAGYYRAGIIEYIGIKLDQEGKKSENYTITGRVLGGLLSERLAMHDTASGTGYDSQSTLASTAMRHYVNLNCMDATDTDRNYPLLYLEDPDPECGGTIKYDGRFQTIAELCEEICLASNLGWEIVLDPTNKKLVFMVIEGLDRSFGNGVRAYTNDPAAGNNIELEMANTSGFTVGDVVTVSSSAGSEQATITIVHINTHLTVNTLAINHTVINPLVTGVVNSPVTFSPKFGNIRLINYVDSNINSKNVAYVAGQGDANLRDVDKVTYLAAPYTGIARREVFIDARDTDATDKRLQRGNERLVELGETKVIEIENLAAGPFSYGEDFYLGDIVTVEHPDIVSADVRVIESIIEIDSENLIQNRLIFGKQYPDIININANKNFLTEVRR